MTQFILDETCRVCQQKLSAMFLRDDPDNFFSPGAWTVECEEGCTLEARE